MGPNLITILQDLGSHLKQARAVLPGMADPDILIVAEAICTSTHPPERDQAPPKGPRTLQAAIAEILGDVTNATTGEIYFAVQRDYPHIQESGKDVYSAVSRALQDERFERIHRGRYCLRPTPKPLNPATNTNDEKAYTTLMAAKNLTQPFLARDVVANSNLKMSWVIVGLKQLNKRGKVRVAEKLTNGMARWEVVS